LKSFYFGLLLEFFLPVFLSGLPIVIYSFISVGLSLFLLSYFSHIWQPYSNLLSNSLYITLPLVIVLAAQFSRSRLSFLSLIWLVFALTLNAKLNSSLPWVDWLNEHSRWLALTGTFVLVLLAFIKDRGLLSVHSFTRVILLTSCGLFAYFWLWLSVLATENVPTSSVFYPWLKYMPIELPIALSFFILSFKALYHGSLLVSALLVSLVIWTLGSNQLVPLTWPMILSFLAIYYLLVVIVESYFLAYRDELTRLPSRRALNQLSLSLGRKYTLAMLDIDHFKKFNDTYGHDIGDQVLKLVAAKLAKVKSGGKVFRYGGEEFTVVFPRKDQSQVFSELDSLRQSIADYKIVIRQPIRKNKQARNAKPKCQEKTISVTISIGVATRTSKQSFEQTLKASDQALYRAKKNGRNNVSD
jgi:diguanylate cyclase (GGDEF)-like protein